ncbi:MAG: arsenate reductase family protein [Gemmatimonadales bacterium]
MEVQVFGVRKSADTRAALRFFAERRIKVHFVDLIERPAAPGELRRFAEKFGLQALVDPASRRFAELGRPVATLERLSLEPLLLRMPLVRLRHQLTIGPAAETWREWIAASGTRPPGG